MLYGYMGTPLNKNGNVYSQATLKSDTKNVTISVPCTLADADIKGNLYITEGVLAGNVTLEDVTVAGDIIVSGGNVTLDGVSALEMVVSNRGKSLCNADREQSGSDCRRLLRS